MPAGWFRKDSYAEFIGYRQDRFLPVPALCLHPGDFARRIDQSLIENQNRVTRVASTGCFMRHGNVTLMIGIEEDQVQAVIDLLYQACCPPEDLQYRATIFMVDMPYFEQI